MRVPRLGNPGKQHRQPCRGHRRMVCCGDSPEGNMAEPPQDTEEREALLRSILDAVPDAMIMIDSHGIVRSFSAAAERLFGYRADEIEGRNVSLLMPSP